jgi:hypothetical protein
MCSISTVTSPLRPTKELLSLLRRDRETRKLGDADQRKDQRRVLADRVAQQIADAALDATPLLDELVKGGSDNRGASSKPATVTRPSRGSPPDALGRRHSSEVECPRDDNPTDTCIDPPAKPSRHRDGSARGRLGRSEARYVVTHQFPGAPLRRLAVRSRASAARRYRRRHRPASPCSRTADSPAARRVSWWCASKSMTGFVCRTLRYDWLYALITAQGRASRITSSKARK